MPASRQCRASSQAPKDRWDARKVRCRMPCRRRGCSWVAVEVLAGPVVAHRGARVGVPGGDLDVPQVYSGIETGRERFTNHAEYLKLRSGEVRALALVAALLA